MTLLRLRFAPDPVLTVKAKRVRTIDASLQRLIGDMIETMHHEGGVGLAANQVGVLRRVAVIQLPEDEEPYVLINPQVVSIQGQRELEEGCLSIPGYRGTLSRAETVRAKALDRNGKSIRIKADGLMAQALEHEIDHLNGILYVDHLDSRDKLHKLEPEPEPEEPVEAGIG
ncbi:MAG: peptide deformylase [Dehalococcoidia bacterium]